MIINPCVKIDNEVFRKIMHWVNKSQYEVSGLGTVVLEPNNVFRVTDAMLLPQKNGMTHTDIEPEDVGKLMFLMKDKPGDLRFWWHSHVEMDVFWSGTDWDTIKKVGAGGWFLSTVFNKRREMRSAYYGVEGQSTPFGVAPLFLDELKTVVEAFADEKTHEWDEQYQKMVTNHVPIHSPWEKTDAGLWEQRLGLPHPLSTVPTITRPPGMSKREWKKHRKEAKKIVPAESVDDYGFTQEERIFLAQMGWDEGDLDDFTELHITPTEILSLAAIQLEPTIIHDMLAVRHWTVEDIVDTYTDDEDDLPTNPRDDDGPVMDRAQGGKYDT